MNCELILKCNSIFEFIPNSTGEDSIDDNIDEICEDRINEIEYSLIDKMKKSIIAKFELFYEELQGYFDIVDSIGLLDIDTNDREDNEEVVEFYFSLAFDSKVNKEKLLKFLKDDMKLLEIKEVDEDWFDVSYNQKDVDDFDEIQILIESYAYIKDIEILDPEDYYR